MTTPAIVESTAPVSTPAATPAVVDAPVQSGATPAAPAGTPAATPAAPATPALAPAGAPKKATTPLLSRQEAKAAAAELARARMAPVTPATPEVKVGETPAAVTTPALVVDTTTTPAPAVTTPAITPSVTQTVGGIKIPLDPNHPAIGGRKVTEITVSSPAEEQVVRAMLNGTYTRRQEVEALQKQIREFEAERSELQRKVIERETLASARSEWEATPHYQASLAKYYEIQKAHGDDAAAYFWRGAQADFQKGAQQRVEAKLSEVQAQDLDRAGRMWASAAKVNADTQLPEVVRTMPEYGQWVDQAIIAFNSELEHGHLPSVVDAESMHAAFIPFLQARLLAQPTVRTKLTEARTQREREAQAAAEAAAKAERDKKAIEDAAIARYLKEQADKRAANPPNPLANVAAASRANVSTTVGSEPEVTAPTTAYQAKRTAREVARQMAKQRFG